jgi:hypothetical protein
VTLAPLRQVRLRRGRGGNEDEGLGPEVEARRRVAGMAEDTSGLESLLMVAEDLRDGRRSEPFTHEELSQLCSQIERAIALLSQEAEG